MQTARLESRKLESWLSPATDFWLTRSSFVLPSGIFISWVFEKYQVSDYMLGQSNAAVAGIISSSYCHCSCVGVR